uniref:Uncharacterized protein n=1 Tax=Anguilla anguilla TaxID=7936 RepID=A0A0E9U0T1_ANGAN
MAALYKQRGTSLFSRPSQGPHSEEVGIRTGLLAQSLVPPLPVSSGFKATP